MSGAEHILGNVGFGPALPPDIANKVMDQMADSIVALTHQLEEAEARIALLEEEQRIFLRKHAPRLTDEELREEVRHKYEADRVGGHHWANI
jgi:hypothetical protein